MYRFGFISERQIFREFQNNENFIIYRRSMILQNECIAIMYDSYALIINHQEKLDLMKNHLSFSI